MYRTVFSLCARHGTPALRRGYAAAASAPPFDWQDPLDAKSLLTEDEIAISETAEKYSQEQLLPRVLRMPHRFSCSPSTVVSMAC